MLVSKGLDQIVVIHLTSQTSAKKWCVNLVNTPKSSLTGHNLFHGAAEIDLTTGALSSLSVLFHYFPQVIPLNPRLQPEGITHGYLTRGWLPMFKGI